jgi:hypothetical protein
LPKFNATLNYLSDLNYIIIINYLLMELLRVIREESGDFAKFESALTKTAPEDVT